MTKDKPKPPKTKKPKRGKRWLTAQQRLDLSVLRQMKRLGI